jgi:hypothetical protein
MVGHILAADDGNHMYMCVTDALNWGHYIASLIDELVMVHEWDRKQKYSGKKSCISTTLSTTNPT